MSLSSNIPEIVEYRGVWGLVAAEVLTDDDTAGYTTGDVFAIAATSEISKAPEGSSEAHYYNNVPAVVIDSEGPDTITIQAAAIPLEVQAEISGQTFDSATSAWIETPAVKKYYALGYMTQDSSGNWVYVWRYKGKFSPLAQTNATRDNGTSANGQELVYTGIHTTHKFTKTSETCKAINVPDSGNADLSTFFDEVTTPDTLTTKTTP